MTEVTTAFGCVQRHFQECGSTSDIARQWAEDSDAPAPSGARVTAEFQTAGRGQRGRQWQAGAGESALLSFVYRLPEGTEIGPLGFVAALAVSDTLRAYAANCRIKWPNDILLNGCKAAGILIEVFGQTAIIGIGINVNQQTFADAAEFVYPPTSLRLATGQAQSVSAVIEAVSHGMTRWEAQWHRCGFAEVLRECRARLAHGAAVRQGSLRGELVGLTDSGAAQVRLADGTFAEWTTVN